MNPTTKNNSIKLKRRDQNGNILIVILASLALIIVPLIILASQGGLYSIDRERAKTAVEAAALVAANNLSRVIIDDPQFGYVSLSNFPPNGEATLARDGEPLPVTGINTLTATIRQLAVLGSEIQNKTISELAEEDRVALESTVDDLNAVMSRALETQAKNSSDKIGTNTSGEGEKPHAADEKLKDTHGVKIDIAKDVRDFLTEHLPPGMKLESLQLDNGWLSSPVRASVPLPSPQRYAHVGKGEAIDGQYRAFVDVPFNEKSFTFAGLGKSSALVNTESFQPADGRHINSIVRVKARFVRGNQVKQVMPFAVAAPDAIEISAVAQPYTLDDSGPAGVMTVRFSGGSTTGLHSWSDFLQKDNFHDRQIMTYQALGGDYPLDSRAVMRPSRLDSADGTAQQFAEHLYYWLRNGHLRPSLGSIVEMLSQRFQSGPNDIYAYEFSNNGNIARRIIARDPFPVGLTADEQVSTTIDTSTNAGVNPIIIFRNNVKRLGNQTGGKHGGQPIAGNPLNWCELAEFGGDDFIAGAVRKGRLATGLSLYNPGDANSTFRTIDGKTICLQPRKSSYSGGLAVDIEIGGINLPKQQMDAQTISLVKRARGGFGPPVR